MQKKQSADLIKKAEEVKASITELRKEVNAFLKTDVPQIPKHAAKQTAQTLIAQKISAIQGINKTIAYKYKSIMADISYYCENVMGKPPCKYAIVGMGSLVREEATPYSDFEHIILLQDDVNYESHLEYFRWFSVIFHVIVINLQESIIPSFNIHCLNSKDCSLGDWFYDAITTRGVSFDGMVPHACKFPLGRQQKTKNKPFTTELIKPVSEMLKYLSSEADLKNGYHLADILTKTCFVYGNQIIFKQFKDGTKNYFDKRSETDTINDIQKQVRNDLDKFSARFRLTKLKSRTAINIKQFVYRSTTLFVSALATKHKISANTCFDLIEQMANNTKITQNVAEKLKYAIAIACEMRLRTYMEKKSQCDNAIDLNQDGIEKFLNIVGVASTVNYFQIAYCLQCEVAKQLNFTKRHFYADPQLINITIGLAFRIQNLTEFSKKIQQPFWEPYKYNFDTCIQNLQHTCKISSEKLNQKTIFEQTIACVDCHGATTLYRFSPKEKLIRDVATYLYSHEIYDEALEFLYLELEIFLRKIEYNSNNHEVASIKHHIGHCLLRLDQLKAALSYLESALTTKQNITLDEGKDKCIASTLDEIGHCLMCLQSFNKALTILNRSLQIKQNATLNPGKDYDIATTLTEMGRCHIKLQNYNEALTILNRSLQIKQNATLNPDKDYDIAVTLSEIGRCHISLENYNEALIVLNRSLQIQQNATLSPDKNNDIAKILLELGRCHNRLQNYDEALTILNRSLQIKQNATLNPDKDNGIAATLSEIGRCHISLENYNEALIVLNRSLQIKQNATLNPDKDENIAFL